MHNNLNKSKILPLESLRGIAAVAVTLHHFRPNSILTSNAFIMNAGAMVDFFFVLSGFVMAINYTGKINTVNELVNFQKKRFWRLYPLHVTMLFVFVGIELLKFIGQNYFAMEANLSAFAHNNLFAFINNVLLTHSLVLERTTFNYPSWSISVEFYTYLVFGLTSILFAKHKISVAVLLVLISAVVLAVVGDPFASNKVSIFRCLYGFFLGILSYNIFNEFKIPSLSTLTFILMAALCFLVSKATTIEMNIVLPPLFALFTILIVSLSKNNILSRILSYRPLVYLGTLSYSIYMVHAAVLWVVFNFCIQVLSMPHMYKDGTRPLLLVSEPISILLAIVCVVMTILVSHFTYKYIEDRFRIKRKG